MILVQAGAIPILRTGQLRSAGASGTWAAPGGSAVLAPADGRADANPVRYLLATIGLSDLRVREAIVLDIDWCPSARDDDAALTLP